MFNGMNFILYMKVLLLIAWRKAEQNKKINLK